MYPCSKCLENKWTFKPNENMVVATCFFCGNEVEFEGRTKTFAKVTSPEDACPRCKEFQLTWREHRPNWKPKKESPYFFTRWLKCGECDFVQFFEEYKIMLH